MSQINKIIFLIILFISLLLSVCVSIVSGPIDISLNQIFQIFIKNFGLGNYQVNEQNLHIYETVLLNIRLPRAILALLVGMSLGISGAMLQGLFRNPLVDPGFIGISSGAALGAMCIIMFANFFFTNLNKIWLPYLLPIFAMLGSIMTTLLVYKMATSERKTNIMTMLLSGIAVNAFVGSVIGLFVIKSTDLQLRTFTFWTLGGLDNANWEVVGISSVLICIPILLTFFLKDKLDILMLGDAEAAYLGLKVEKLKKTIIITASFMVGVSVSFCGMIGFIGLVTPHLVRLCIGPNHKYLLIGSGLLGSLLLLIADSIARLIIAPAQIPISIVTSLIGAPFFIYLILEQKRRYKIA